MRSNDFNPRSDPVARGLHDANARLQDVQDHLWELSQPAEVRAARQAAHDEQALVARWGIRLVLGLVLAWVVLVTLFGARGARVFGGTLSLAWQVIEVLLVLGFFLVVGQTLWRGVRWLAGRPGAVSSRGNR